MKIKLLLAVICLVGASCASARTIKVAAGLDKPPYTISSDNSGFELDLVNEILTSLGHTMVPVYIQLGRTTVEVTSDNVDIGLTLNIKHAIDREILSDVYVVYQNVAITLKSRNIDIEHVNDLKNFTVIGFQTASQVLGEEFRQAMNGHPSYLEIPQQKRQVSMLLLGSVDVAVMDRNIFNYFKRQLPQSQQHATEVHELFGISAYRAGIPDPQLREQFNQKLREMKSNGRYQELMKKYQLLDLLNENQHF